jgi:hypothetical protein
MLAGGKRPAEGNRNCMGEEMGEEKQWGEA